MSDDNYGVRKWDTECKVCGAVYQRTNWMTRWAVSETGYLERTDTHQIGCRKWTVVSAAEMPVVRNMTNEERLDYMKNRANGNGKDS